MIFDEAVNVNADLIARLRQLADVLEHEEAPDLKGYAALLSCGHIMIKESAFLKLFAGQSVSGRKDDHIIYASAKACGITFEALLYDSDDGRVRGVTIRL